MPAHCVAGGRRLGPRERVRQPAQGLFGRTQSAHLSGTRECAAAVSPRSSTDERACPRRSRAPTRRPRAACQKLLNAGRLVLSERAHPDDEREYEGIVPFFDNVSALAAAFTQLVASGEWAAATTRAGAAFRVRFSPRAVLRRARVVEDLMRPRRAQLNGGGEATSGVEAAPPGGVTGVTGTGRERRYLTRKRAPAVYHQTE